MKISKKIILVILLFVLSSCTFKYMSKYKTSNLFETEKYYYTITYPVKQPDEWYLFHGSTDASMREFSDGSILHATAIITKQNPKGVARDKIDKFIGGSLQIFILDKKNIQHQNLLKSIENNPYILSATFSDTKNNKTYIYLEDIYKQLNDNENNYGDLGIILNIDENNAILFAFYGSTRSENYNFNDYSKRDKEKLGKEIYKIINSLTREKIK